MTKADHMNGRPARPSWNPGQYLRFADHRLRPALELLDRVALDAPEVIFDLGCGTGNVTRIIASRWPAAAVFGLDSSDEMLQTAGAEPADVRWLKGEIEHWTPKQPPDLIYANAALHWVDGHRTLVPHLFGCLRPGGCLAIQMPLSWGAPSHRLMRETLANGGPGGQPLGSSALRAAMEHRRVETAAIYHDLLVDDAHRIDIWETEYLQVLEGEDPVLQWVSGTGLRPILDGLEDDERVTFLERYRSRLREAYPPRPNGSTLYPFRRLFIVACR